ncbi:hypothetical protein BG006_002807 [Podila minutissima]|uniref:Uncharacterized protein n=1 Tax=Podila minutissima TaxID=64525 RepID=A0A9P5VR40_9FUNG|nr:hypothetical protein BG006_002807 [Podila minutissima]
MKIQVSAIVGPIFLLSLAARPLLAKDTSTTENVSTLSPGPDLIADIEQHTQLDRGLATAVEPEETVEVGGEEEAYEEDEYDDEDDDDEDYSEYDEYDDEYDDEEEVDNEDEDQDADEFAEYDEDKPSADDKDIELNGVDLEAASQETEEGENADFNAQTEDAATGIHPVKADPLTESFSTCKPSTQSSLHKRNKAPTPPTDQGVSAQATAEPGGACIDSFVNFALRFQEHCSVFCLKTFTHIFAKPNVLGVLDCFGCSNFIVQGFIALGQDCVGLFTSDPMTPEDIRRAREAKAMPIGAPAPAPTRGVKSKGDKTIAGQGGNGSQLRGAEPLSLNNVISSLQNVDMGQVHEWLEIGKGIVSVINAGAKNNQAQETALQPQQPQGEVLVETQAGEQGQVRAQENEKQEFPKVDKDEFNEYIIKAAKFANWGLTPKMIDDSGIYDRVHESGVF